MQAMTLVAVEMGRGSTAIAMAERGKVKAAKDAAFTWWAHLEAPQWRELPLLSGSLPICSI